MESKELFLQEGMLVRVKDDISNSLSRFGHNDEKDNWNGQIKKVHKVEGRCVYLYRSKEKSYNFTCTSG